MKVRIGGFARLDRADEDRSKAIRDETVELEEGDAIHGAACLDCGVATELVRDG